jgi:hypothetical protein
LRYIIRDLERKREKGKREGKIRENMSAGE